MAIAGLLLHEIGTIRYFANLMISCMCCPQQWPTFKRVILTLHIPRKGICSILEILSLLCSLLDHMQHVKWINLFDSVTTYLYVSLSPLLASSSLSYTLLLQSPFSLLLYTSLISLSLYHHIQHSAFSPVLSSSSSPPCGNPHPPG